MQDIDRGEAQLFAKATKFYEGIGTVLAAAGHTLDVFAAALDQVGLAELRTAVSDSGARPQTPVIIADQEQVAAPSKRACVPACVSACNGTEVSHMAQHDL